MNKVFWDYWQYIGLKQHRVRIINTAGSAINCFETKTIDEIIKSMEVYRGLK